MKTILILFIFLLACDKPEKPTNTFIDERDGNEYTMIEIGDNIWMGENLRYKPSGYNYLLSDKYGTFYPFNDAVQYAPKGWHLPTCAEWEALIEVISNGYDLRAGEFAAQLGGWVQVEYLSEGRIGAWWTADEMDDVYAYLYYIKADTDLTRINLLKTCLLTVRCVKDK